MRLKQIIAVCNLAGLLVGASPAAYAEYVVLRSGARLNVTGYEILGNKYRLQMKGGTAEVLVEDVVSIEPEEIFEPLPEPLSPTTPFHDIIRAAGLRYGVDPDLIHCVIAVESNFNPKAISFRNARGLMQLLPSTASRMGVKNIFDPKENVDGGTRYLREMLARYHNDVTLALAAYNAGPEKVQRYGNQVPPYQETQNYVRTIARGYAKIKTKAAVTNGESSLTPAEIPSSVRAER
jgi:Transglycosylase SLT domain